MEVPMMGFRTDAKPGEPFWMGDLNWSGTQCGIDSWSPEGMALRIGETEMENWDKVTCPACLEVKR